MIVQKTLQVHVHIWGHLLYSSTFSLILFPLIKFEMILIGVEYLFCYIDILPYDRDRVALLCCRSLVFLYDAHMTAWKDFNRTSTHPGFQRQLWNVYHRDENLWCLKYNLKYYKSPVTVLCSVHSARVLQTQHLIT